MMVAYTVIAAFPDEVTRGDYLEWLRSEHIAEVIEAGAASATVVRLDRGRAEEPIAVEVRYLFASREALDAYVRERAPALRAKGLARFPPEREITFRRATGDIVHVA